MIAAIVRTGFMNLRRDRAALTLSFVVPIVFFSIFAVIFGQQRNSTAKVHVAIADEDHSDFSQRLIEALQSEGGLRVQLTPAAEKNEAAKPPYDRAGAEKAVRNGDVPVALVIPAGMGAKGFTFAPEGKEALKLILFNDSSDPVASQVVAGLLQKAAMTAMPDVMAATGSEYFEKATGGLTPQQRAGLQKQLDELRQLSQQRKRSAAANDAAKPNDAAAAAQGGLIPIDVRDLLGENKVNPIIAFYAAGVGVMFMLFTASGAGGALLDEAESGTLDRVLSSRVTMTSLLAGKHAYIALLGCAQLLIMFIWGQVVFKLDLLHHIPGFIVMSVATALAAGGFGLVLATLSKTRAQLGSLSTLLVLSMSALGGSMFPRFLMPEGMQRFGLLTFNAWALDGFTKVFWRDEPISHLWPQVSVLLVAAVVFFLIAHQLARRWDAV